MSLNQNKMACAVVNENNLSFPDFDKIKVSTKTFIVMTNITIDIENLFNFLPITDYTVIPKKRGRKKKNEPVDPNVDIPDGSIITLEYTDRIRGVDLKKKTKKNVDKKRGKYFRNSVTVVMMIDGKKINFKASRNKFQLTGCKFDKHAETCILYLWNYIKNNPLIYKMVDNEDSNQQLVYSDGDNSKEDSKETTNILKAIFIPAMRNIDFSLNFFVDREKLDEYFNTCTDYHSLLETSFGYTGVNIKIPLEKDIKDLQLKQLSCVNGKWDPKKFVSYEYYLTLLPQKESDKKLKKERYNTFLVFHSGKIIMSGLEASYMKDTYYDFLSIIKECHHIIEEKLESEDEN